tara:strand:- start:151 stop:1263 length:1113 start_codon:yes stop_codon:yes gene_type:complete
MLGGGAHTLATFALPDNVIMRPRTDLTSSERSINTRFSAPGGPEIQTIGYLDAYTQTYSVHNALPWRNLSVLGSGSGENRTIKVEDENGYRRGLRTLRALHQGKFGSDGTYTGTAASTGLPANGSFNKQHRNQSRAYQYGPDVDLGSDTKASGSFYVWDNNHGGNTPSSMAGGILTIRSGDLTQKGFKFVNNGLANGALDGSNPVIQTNGVSWAGIGEQIVGSIIHANGLLGKVTANFESSSAGKITITVTEADLDGTLGNPAAISGFASALIVVNAPGSGQPFNNGIDFVSNIQTTLITGSYYDNMHINTPIPRSEFQYSWIRNAISGSGWRDTQTRILGYGPKDGLVSSSAGYVEAIVFPSASTIIGS